jgi:hypothetical protein
MKKGLSNTKVKINTSNFPAGNYIINITSIKNLNVKKWSFSMQIRNFRLFLSVVIPYLKEAEYRM